MKSTFPPLPTLPKAVRTPLLQGSNLPRPGTNRMRRLDEEPCAEHEAPRQQEPDPELMAEDAAAPTRPLESVQNRSGATCQAEGKVSGSVFALPPAVNRDAGFAGVAQRRNLVTRRHRESGGVAVVEVSIANV